MASRQHARRARRPPRACTPAVASSRAPGRTATDAPRRTEHGAAARRNAASGSPSGPAMRRRRVHRIGHRASRIGPNRHRASRGPRRRSDRTGKPADSPALGSRAAWRRPVAARRPRLPVRHSVSFALSCDVKDVIYPHEHRLVRDVVSTAPPTELQCRSNGWRLRADDGACAPLLSNVNGFGIKARVPKHLGELAELEGTEACSRRLRRPAPDEGIVEEGGGEVSAARLQHARNLLETLLCLGPAVHGRTGVHRGERARLHGQVGHIAPNEIGHDHAAPAEPPRRLEEHRL
mmetsp:Transcript_29760/g.80005  ORF Transcript_29760/g.80005 Transcript_29760/m.80005 type:complete len:292 (+) Transcript_29760:1-876(+)